MTTRAKRMSATAQVESLLSSGPEKLKELVRAALEEILEAEMSEALSAEPGERTQPDEQPAPTVDQPVDEEIE